MFLSLPNERLLFAEETGADGLPGGGGGAVVSDEGGDAGGDYDYGEEGDIDLLGGESDDELDSGESVESSGSESPGDAAVDVDSEAVAELDETESTDDVDGFDDSPAGLEADSQSSRAADGRGSTRRPFWSTVGNR